MTEALALLIVVTSGWTSRDVVPASACPWMAMRAQLAVAEQARDVRFIRAECVREERT